MSKTALITGGIGDLGFAAARLVAKEQETDGAKANCVAPGSVDAGLTAV
jgi:hypothetical protein